MVILRTLSQVRGFHHLGLPLASTAAVIALTSFTAPAKALSFNWQFSSNFGQPVSGGTVTGTISGLLDNTPNQITGLTVTVTAAQNSPAGGWINDWVFDSGNGFSVVSGQITGGDAFFKNSVFDRLRFGDGNGTNTPELSNLANTIINSSTLDYNTYTPQISAVPGPLPILGAASALGWSRRVRSRLRNAQRSAR